MTPREKATKLLQSVGATLVRTKRHLVWRLPDGRTHTAASTPGCWSSDLNNLHDLRHTLGQVPVFKEGERREKTKKQPHNGNGKVRTFRPTHNPVLADQLRLSGVLEQGLRNQISKLTVERDLANERAEKAEQQIAHCFWCRRKAWFKVFRSRFVR